MKYFITTILILVSIFTIKGQSTYYLKDTITSYGENIIDNGEITNSKLCVIKTKNQFIEYTPYEIKEYRLDNNTVYISKQIVLNDSVKQVFLERLYDGNRTLFYYRDSKNIIYFIQTDSSTLVQLPATHQHLSEFRNKLYNQSNACVELKNTVKLVSGSKISITEFFKRAENCIRKPYAFFRYGAITGVEITRLIPVGISKSGDIDFKNNGGTMYGLFLDLPVFMSDFSVHAELYYTKHAFSYNKLTENGDYDFVANVSSVKIPLYLRYTIPLRTMRPYINTGLVYVNNFRRESDLYESVITDNIIELVRKPEYNAVSPRQIGISAGVGWQYDINYRNSLSVEFRYNYLFPTVTYNSFRNSEFQILTAINF